jgi:hypothetical protein
MSGKEDFSQLIVSAEISTNPYFAIPQYLEILRNRIAPKEEIKQWGSTNDIYAYSLIYRKGLKLIKVGSHGTGRYEGGSSGLGGTYPGHEVIKVEKGLRFVHSVLGVALKPEGGLVVLRKEDCANSPYYQKSTNPLNWGIQFDAPSVGYNPPSWEQMLWEKWRYEDDLPGDWRPKEVREAEKRQRRLDDMGVEKRNMERYRKMHPQKEYLPVGGFKVDTQEGLQQFAQALADFYVSLKTG